MSDPGAVTDRREAERREWWVDRLTRRGMTTMQAERLADECDRLHDVVEALESGCPPELAFDIYS